MLRWLKVLVVVPAVALAGCSGVKELGPADPSKVPAVDKEKVNKQMQESMKHMPPGAKMPPNFLPTAPAEAPPANK
jgi:hypothetical protein